MPTSSAACPALLPARSTPPLAPSCAKDESFAKTMDVMGQDECGDAAGKKHDWRADLLAALAKRQRPDGSWVNENDRWMEGDPNLVTGYALMALGHAKPRK